MHTENEDIRYYVEEQTIMGITWYVVMVQMDGFEPTEAHDDWFRHREDAQEIADRLTEEA